MFKKLDPADLDTVKYVAAIFDTSLYGGRSGNSGRFFVRTRDASIVEQLYNCAAGSVSKQSDGQFVWYGSTKDHAFYLEVLEHMHSPARKEKLASAIQCRVEKAASSAIKMTEKASLQAAANHLDKMIQQVQEIKEENSTNRLSTPQDTEAPNGRYRDGTPRLLFEGKKLIKDLELEERAQYQERLRSRPKIRLAIESLQLIMLLGEKEKHPPELIAKARERRELLQQCILAEGVDTCVEKHAPAEWPDWYKFDKTG